MIRLVDILDIFLSAREIPAAEEVDLRRGFVQGRVIGRYIVPLELFLVSGAFQPLISHYIDALLLIRIDLAPAVVAPTAGPVPLLLGAYRHGAQE